MADYMNDHQLIELKDLILQLNNTIKTLNDTIAKQQQENHDLRAEVEWFKRKFFGSSSERMTIGFPGQLNMFEEEEEVAPELIEPEIVPLPKKSRKKKPTLEEQFKNIPTREVKVDSLTDKDKICDVCGSALLAIGTEELRTEIVYTPPKLERVVYIGVTYACKECEKGGDSNFIKSKCPPALLPGSYVSESLLSYIAYRKFGLYLPLYRQEKDLEEQGAHIGRTSMAHWIILSSQMYLQHMYDHFHRELIKRDFIMMDETPVQVLKEEDRAPQSKSYFWVTRTGEDGLNPIILYNYTPTRAGYNAKEFLKGIKPGTYLMADGFSGYNVLENVKRCCCYAHVRRYFLEAVPTGKVSDYSNPAVQGSLYCNKMFEFERSYKERGLSHKQIKNRRLKDQKPIIEGLLSWAKTVKPGSNSKLKKAITYLLNREEFLMTYLEDGRCSFSNNLSENSIRPVTVGRKNWLFSDTPDGAHANTIYLTIVEMAKAYDLNLYDYLEFLFTKRPNKNMTDKELDQLAPWNKDVQKICKKNNETSTSETC